MHQARVTGVHTSAPTTAADEGDDDRDSDDDGDDDVDIDGDDEDEVVVGADAAHEERRREARKRVKLDLTT